MTSKKSFFILTIILLLSTALRFFLIDKNSLWYDEAISIILLLVSNIFSSTLSALINTDQQGLLYYPILSVWSHLFGISVFSLRALSAIMNITTIFIFFIFGKLFFSKEKTLWAMFILGISPLHIWYSQEIKSYSMAILLTLLSLTILIFALEKDKKIYWLGFIFSSLFSLISNNHAFLILLATLSFLTVEKWRKKWKNFFISLGIILICFVPYVFFILYPQFKIVEEINWILSPPPMALLFTFFEFNLGYNSEFLLYIISGIILGIIFFNTFMQRRKSPEEWRKFKLISFLLLFPIITSYIISQKTPVYITRYFLSVSPLYYLLIGVSIGNLSHKYKWLFVIPLISLMGISCFCYYQNRFEEKFPWNVNYPFHHGICRKDDDIDRVMDIFNRHVKEHDILAISHQSLIPTVFFYSKHYFKNNPNLEVVYLGKNKEEIKPLSIPNFFVLTQECLSKNRHFSSVIGKFSSTLSQERKKLIYFLDRNDIENLDFERMWLILSSWDSNNDGYSECSMQAKNWCDNNLKKIMEKKVGNVGILLYENAGRY